MKYIITFIQPIYHDGYCIPLLIQHVNVGYNLNLSSSQNGTSLVNKMIHH